MIRKLLVVHKLQMIGNLMCNRKTTWLVVLMALVQMQAGAQILTTDQVKKLAPDAFFFAGQSAATQLRNTSGLKNSAGKLVLVGFVDTSGYSTAIAQKYQGFLITETKISFDGTSLDPGEYGFGFKDGKFTVMNVAASDLFSVDSHNDDQLKRPVPLKIEKDGDAYRLYAGRKYVTVKAD
jgi:hypothetical protein